jgi:hypothetical protein
MRMTADRISETVSLPANDPEAIAFLRSQSSAPLAPSTTSASTNPTLPAGLDTFSVPPDSFPEVKPGQTDSISTDSAAASTTDPAPPASTTDTPAPRPPVPVNKAAIRRKPRQSLEQMAAGLKGKKMTTLEKVSDCIQKARGLLLTLAVANGLEVASRLVHKCPGRTRGQPSERRIFGEERVP